jgi:hypothetical protein
MLGNDKARHDDVIDLSKLVNPITVCPLWIISNSSNPYIAASRTAIDMKPKYPEN